MPVHYSLPGVELNLMTPGLPHGYRGPVIKGSDQSHITDNFGETVNQSVTTGKASINLQYKKWHAGTEMICHHEFLPGMFTRILLHERQKEKIMGVGKVTLEAGQFYSLLGSRFTTIMAHEQATESCNLGLWWSVNFIREIIPEYPALRREIRAILEDIPRKMIAPPLSLTDDMQSMINELLEFDYTEPGAQKLLHGKMKKLARMIITESMELHAVKKSSVRNNWDQLQQAIELIRANPLHNFNEQELGARVLLGASTLRKGIKKITGVPFAEFCRTEMYIESGRQIVLDREMVKNVLSSAGYASRTAFTKGFEAIFWCTPGELRARKKKLQLNNNYVMSIEDKYKYGSIIARYMSERETLTDLEELNKWLEMNDQHLQLFGTLLDGTKTGWTKQWFDAAGIKHNRIRWTKDGDWYRYDLSRDEQIEFYKYATLLALSFIIYYFILVES